MTSRASMMEGAHVPGVPDDRPWHSWALLALLVAPLAAGAYWAYPSWDDGLFWFQLNELGPSVWHSASGDRPLLGFMLASLGRLGLLPGSLALFFIATWMGTGLIVRRYWIRLFPRATALAPVAAGLAVSPLLIQTQLIGVYPILSGHMGCVVALSACLLADRAWQTAAGRQIARGGAAALVLGASLISEYAVLATIIGSVGLVLGPVEPDVRRRREGRISAGVLCLAALVGYLVYHATASAGARPDVRPEIALANQGVRRLLELPVRLPFAVWAGTLGELARGVGELTFFSGSIVGIAYGSALAAGAFVVLRRRISGTEGPPPDADDGRAARVLVAGLALGLAPIILMTSSPQQNIASRVWFPLFPGAVCLSVWLVFRAIRPRYHLMAALGCIFLAGYLCANAAAMARSIRQSTDRLSLTLRERLSPSGLTVALFTSYPTNSFVGSPIARPYELAARLSRNWTEAERKRFWAGATDWAPLANHVPQFAGVCGPVPDLDSATAGWTRRGSVQRLLWVSYGPDGQYKVIEGAPGPQAAR